jgi:hypothetical protein
MLYARHLDAASAAHAGWTKDYTSMLTLVINGMTGLIAALVIASLIQSVRAFGPAWLRLQAEVNRLEQGAVLHVTLREAGPADVQRLAAPAITFAPHGEGSVIAQAPAVPTALTPQYRRVSHSHASRAVARALHT